jgi:hypothetical protein
LLSLSTVPITLAMTPDLPFVYDWNSGFGYRSLNSFDEWDARCIENLKTRLKQQLVNAEITERNARPFSRSSTVAARNRTIVPTWRSFFQCASSLEEQC